MANRHCLSTARRWRTSFSPSSIPLLDTNIWFLRRPAAVISEVVAAEIEQAPERVQQQYGEIAALTGSQFLSLTPEAIERAAAYEQRGIVSPKYLDDGTHIALATTAGVDLLVSWNFKHIVHFEKIRLFNAVNLEFGYRPLQIYSPREVTHHGSN